MNKVVTINLNGRAYQLEEKGYDALKTYLHRATKRLQDDPDRDEIIADFEQAISEKCDQYLKDGKTVVADREIETIIKEMGPVHLDDRADDDSTPPLKRFYLLPESGNFAGVCSGIAAYFNIDVTVVRVAAVLLALITHGVALGAYVIIALLAPKADTPEKRATARGDRFDSEALLESARKKYASVSEKVSNQDNWKKLTDQGEPALNQVGIGIRRAMRILSGVISVASFVALLGIVAAAVAGTSSLLFSGQLFGVALEPDVTGWLFALFIGCGFLIAAIPIALLGLTAYKYAHDGSFKQSLMPWVAALTIFAIAVGLFVAIPSASPAVRDTITHYGDNFNHGNETCFGYCR